MYTLTWTLLRHAPCVSPCGDARAHMHLQHLHLIPPLAPRKLLSRPQHPAFIKLSSWPRSSTSTAGREAHVDGSWSEICVSGESERAKFTMSESRHGVDQRGSLGRRLSRKFSSWWDGAAEVEAKVGDVAEDVSGSGPSELTYGASKPEHLVVLVNGIWGSANNWRFAAGQFKERLGDKVVVHCSAKNSGLKTHSGVDIMGTRLAKEVMEVVGENPGVTKISFVGHSLGGLISRYAIGLLYAPKGGRTLLQERSGALSVESEAGGSGGDHIEFPVINHERPTIAGLEPVNFITLATPHLGCRGNNHLPFLFGRTALEWAAPLVSPLIIGPTGRHLFLADGNKDPKGQPLLQRMVTDCDEGKFLSALQSFKRRIAYANVGHDRMVGWRTASIRKAKEKLPKETPKNKYIDPNYRYIVHVEEIPLANKDGSEPKDAPALDDIEEVMVAGLQKAPWLRVDVDFSETDSVFEAHNLIQVKFESWHGEGRYVFHHLIDNYFSK